MSELADEADSKSVGGNIVWVQVPLPALKNVDFKGFIHSYDSMSNQIGNQIFFTIKEMLFRVFLFFSKSNYSPDGMNTFYINV